VHYNAFELPIKIVVPVNSNGVLGDIRPIVAKLKNIPKD